MSESTRRLPFPFPEFEPRWQQRWEEEQTFREPNPGEPGFDPSKPKFYVLDMFPYPSGAGLHVGHPEGYTATDILARARRAQGMRVLHPMGWDAFGLPAEQYAIKTGQHPAITTAANIDNFRRQLKALGFSYDWSREISTTDSGYVRWTQWIFLQLYHAFVDESGRVRPVEVLRAQGWSEERIDEVRLAYVSEAPVNWSPDLGTVLANEEVDEWREKGHTVERRPLRQWMLRITALAERLLSDLDLLDWPEGIKQRQRDWIGRSEGASVTFRIAPPEGGAPSSPPGAAPRIEVFTTRPDTLFGATYLVLAPEHPLVDQVTTAPQADAVAAYQAGCAVKSDLERTELSKDKTGVFTGAYAINPVNGERIPVWIADYVMMGYGTGAIMAVPAHDQRDFEFATTFDLPIRKVVQIPDGEGRGDGFGDDDESGDGGEDARGVCFSGHGIALNSANDTLSLDGLATAEAKEAMIAWLEANDVGARKVTYKLRDWLFSRQRYWGEPFPIVWKDGRHRALDESELPLLQPELEDFAPTGDPRGPLAKATDWLDAGDGWTRETNTMPQWAGSCWYYLRYCDPNNFHEFLGAEAERAWTQPVLGPNPDETRSVKLTMGAVDLYVGGTEHAVLHLLYARFWHKCLYDLGHLATPEPFQRLVNQGLILGEDGRKMSKSLGNVVNPDDVIREFGADSLRLYEMFMGPLEKTKPWSTAGVQGVSRFLAKVWRLALVENPGAVAEDERWSLNPKLTDAPREEAGKAANKALAHTVAKVTADLEPLSFNTSIAQMMIGTDALAKAQALPVALLVDLLKVLQPFAPHLAEEINARLAAAFPTTVDATMLCQQPWPEVDERWLVEDEVELVVQVNGKLRDHVTVAKDAAQGAIEAAALAAPNVLPFTEGKTIRKVIVVPGRLVNIVAN